MNILDQNILDKYVIELIIIYNEKRINLLYKLTLKKLLTQYFNLFEVNTTANNLVLRSLDMFIVTSGERLFCELLKSLAVFIAERTYGRYKLVATEADLEFVHHDVHYILAIKSGLARTSPSQQSELEQELDVAVTRIKQLENIGNVQPVIGTCFGKERSGYVKGYLEVVGTSFWNLISGNPNLYRDVIIPLGYRVKEYTDSFSLEKDVLINRFSREFIALFCDARGAIDWVKLVEFNSGNCEPDETQP